MFKRYIYYVVANNTSTQNPVSPSPSTLFY